MQYWFVMYDYAKNEFVALEPNNPVVTTIRAAKIEYEPMGYKVITGPFDDEQQALEFIEDIV